MSAIGHNSKPVTDDDMHNAAEFYRKFGATYKEARRHAAATKANKEILLKKLALNAPAKSFTEREAIAMTQDEYTIAVQLYIDADAELEGLEMDFKANEAMRGIWQTLSANERGKS